MNEYLQFLSSDIGETLTHMGLGWSLGFGFTLGAYLACRLLKWSPMTVNIIQNIEHIQG